MKIKALGIKTRLIAAIFVSAGTAGAWFFLTCVLLVKASKNKPFATFFVKNVWAFALLFFIYFVVLMISVFLLLIWRKVKYMEDITKTLKTISGGDLDIHIPVKSRDELGMMAETVNDMAFRLKTALEEERRIEKTKNDLVTNISHDLRTPLTSVLGYLDLMMNMNPDDREGMKRHLHTAHDKCRELKTLMDELFEYSKLNHSDMRMNQMRINVREIVEQVLVGFIPVLMDAGMEYQLHASERGLYIQADPVLLARVFDNLMTNAVKYGREGKFIDVELARENDEVWIRVRNYGKTIPENDLPFLFEKFYQVDKPRSAADRGSGLGLAIVKRIVEMHHGTISVSSSNQSTAFDLRLKADTSIIYTPTGL